VIDKKLIAQLRDASDGVLYEASHAEHIEVCSPCNLIATHLKALLDEVERLNEEREGVQKNYESLHHDYAELSKVLIENKQLRELLERAGNHIEWTSKANGPQYSEGILKEIEQAIK
jgi:hypothetical protein